MALQAKYVAPPNRDKFFWQNSDSPFTIVDLVLFMLGFSMVPILEASISKSGNNNYLPVAPPLDRWEHFVTFLCLLLSLRGKEQKNCHTDNSKRNSLTSRGRCTTNAEYTRTLKWQNSIMLVYTRTHVFVEMLGRAVTIEGACVSVTLISYRRC